MKKTLEIAVVVAAVLGSGIRARAETYTVPLNLFEVNGANGPYLSADFDFHAQFSSIEAITVNFTMPAGYEGTAVAGGYFSIFSQMWVVVTGGSDAPVFGYFFPSISNQLGSAFFSVPAGEVQQFTWLYGYDEVHSFDIALETTQPDFLLDGKGSVAWSDVVDSDYSFEPLDGPDTFTTTWQVPGEVVDASITIVGTSVPEPESFVLLALGFACLCDAVRRKNMV